MYNCTEVHVYMFFSNNLKYNKNHWKLYELWTLSFHILKIFFKYVKHRQSEKQ